MICLDLHSAGKVQETLLHASDTRQRIGLMQAMDALCKRYGREPVAIDTAGTVKLGASGATSVHRPKQRGGKTYCR